MTTSNGTLTWKYVTSGLFGTAPATPATRRANGHYFVQLDANGGGWRTFFQRRAKRATPSLISGLDGLLAHLRQTE